MLPSCLLTVGFLNAHFLNFELISLGSYGVSRQFMGPASDAMVDTK